MFQPVLRHHLLKCPPSRNLESSLTNSPEILEPSVSRIVFVLLAFPLISTSCPFHVSAFFEDVHQPPVEFHGREVFFFSGSCLQRDPHQRKQALDNLLPREARGMERHNRADVLQGLAASLAG